MIKKEIIYSPSYKSLIFFMSHFQLESIIVMTSNKMLINFCKNSKINFYQLTEISSSLSKEKIISYTNFYLNKCNEFNNCRIYFTHNIFDYWGLFFLVNLKNNNKVFFVSKDPFYPVIYFQIKHVFNFIYFRNLIDCIILLYYHNIFYNIFFISDGKYCLGLSKKRLLKKFLHFNNQSSNHILNENKYKINKEFFNNDIIPNQKFDVLIIDSPIESFYESFKPLFTELINLLKSMNFNVSVKRHPNFDFSYDYPSTFQKIPPYFPIELIDLNCFRFAIGYHSSSLVDISNNIKTISLINMIEFYDQDYKCYIIKHLLNNFNNNKILAPTNFADFKRYIS